MHFYTFLLWYNSWISFYNINLGGIFSIFLNIKNLFWKYFCVLIVNILKDHEVCIYYYDWGRVTDLL